VVMNFFMVTDEHKEVKGSQHECTNCRILND